MTGRFSPLDGVRIHVRKCKWSDGVSRFDEFSPQRRVSWDVGLVKPVEKPLSLDVRGDQRECLLSLLPQVCAPTVN